MEHENETYAWVDGVKARGLDSALTLFLDVIEPLGAIGASLLYVFQPISGVFGWRDTVGKIATALEEPGGIDAIRDRLKQQDSAD